MAHNKSVYFNVLNSLVTNRNTLLIHGTGMGKSFIVLELLRGLFIDRKTLFVVPTWDVADNFKLIKDYKDIEQNIEFCTYNYFSSKKKVSYVKNNYDFVIFDEAHHLGSDKYGKMALDIISSTKKKDFYVLGLTATNKREDNLDVADFFSDVVYGVSIYNAIQDGLIPPFEYLMCKTDFDIKINRWGISKSSVKEYLDLSSSLPKLKDTVERNPRKRWMVFFSNIKEMNNKERFVRDAFPSDYKFIKISSKNTSKVSEITDYDKTVVLSVDKLIEGIHTPDTQGIILFRNIQSLRVFQQILGRVVNIKSENCPVIIDCTNTAFRLFRKLNKLNNEANDEKHIKTNIGNRPILITSVQNIEHYNLEVLLTKMDEEINSCSFTYKGVKYDSFTKCCEAYGLSVGSVYARIKNNNYSKEEAINDALLFKQTEREKHEKQNGLVLAAKNKYFNIGGLRYLSVDDLYKSNDWNKLKACAALYGVDENLLCKEIVGNV